jgi:hypothetical protein
VIYDPDIRKYEVNEICAVEGDQLILVTGLQDDYPKNSSLVVLKEVGYKHYHEQNILKRKVNKGNFKPIIHIKSHDTSEKNFRAWKGYKFEVLDELQNQGLINQIPGGKSLLLNDKGKQKALELIKKYIE